MFLISRSPATQEGDADGWGGGEEGDKERDPLGSPSAVEGGEVKPQMLDVITTLETRVV